MLFLTRVCNVSVLGSRDFKNLTNVDEGTLRRKRVRNRWFKAVTLVNNPSLVFERLEKRYQTEMEQAGHDADDRFALKVITLW